MVVEMVPLVSLLQLNDVVLRLMSKVFPTFISTLSEDLQPVKTSSTTTL